MPRLPPGLIDTTWDKVAGDFIPSPPTDSLFELEPDLSGPQALCKTLIADRIFKSTKVSKAWKGQQHPLVPLKNLPYLSLRHHDAFSSPAKHHRHENYIIH